LIKSIYQTILHTHKDQYMPTLNAPATLQQAVNHNVDYSTAIIEVLLGATVLATHTASSWAASNTGNDGTATATMANGGAETIVADGTADGARMSIGGRVITLSLGLSGSGAELILSSLTYVTGETSTVVSLVSTYPAA
jgi:hypothetical protein